ncbi:DUF2255 family protein [Spirillospora sp. NPDC047279]|uniref:DUF2255 family protein n=1 Tax=Spirillospora sp. NPDC047279 TaxID=3155478 RepID=UPI0034029C69
MTTWTATELGEIDQNDELDLQSERADGSLRRPVTMWVVRHDDDLYVRAVKGRDGWYKGTRSRHQGHIRSGKVDKDVSFVDAEGDSTLDEALDTAYRTKYRDYSENIVGHVTNDQARGATLKLVPR